MPQRILKHKHRNLLHNKDLGRESSGSELGGQLCNRNVENNENGWRDCSRVAHNPILSTPKQRPIFDPTTPVPPDRPEERILTFDAHAPWPPDRPEQRIQGGIFHARPPDPLSVTGATPPSN